MKIRGVTLGAAAVALLLLPAQIFAQTTTPTAQVGQVAVTIAVDLDPASAAGIRPEGLIADSAGRLYTSDTASRRLWRYDPASGDLKVLGTLPTASTGMAFDKAGSLYLASGDTVLKIGAAALQKDSLADGDAQVFARGVTGANGLIFDSSDRLYVSGAATGNIYVMAADGITRTFATGFKSERQEQQISTNGLGFGPDGKLYSANTGTGAIDRITVNADGTAGAVERCVTDPMLLGADGIAFAENGDLYVATNEQNAIVRVTPAGQVIKVAGNDNKGPLEFPASLAFSGDALYASNFDVARGANNPADPGIGASIARLAVGVRGALPATQGSAGTPQVAATPSAAPVETATVQPTATGVGPGAPPETPVATVGAVSPATPESTVSPVAPGMPSTGESQPWTIALLLTLCTGVAILLAGLVLSRGRASR